MSEKYKVHDQDSPYFVTFAVEGWIDVFTRPIYKVLIVASLRYCQREKGLTIYAWCLMTNHIHLIIGRNGSETIGDIIRDFKKYTSVHVCRAIANNDSESRKKWMLKIFAEAASRSRKHEKYKFWEDEYHPVELYSNAGVNGKLDYIHENPVKEGIVEKAEEYVYSSARDYYGMKGLIEITYLD